jgi:hypothetical protein
MGNSHPVVLAYVRFLHLYERLETRLEIELDHAYGYHLGPALMVFRVQLNIRTWIVCQLDVAETECLSPPDFCQGLYMLKVQNNLMWLPTVTNVPALLALRVTTRALTSSWSTRWHCMHRIWRWWSWSRKQSNPGRHSWECHTTRSGRSSPEPQLGLPLCWQHPLYKVGEEQNSGFGDHSGWIRSSPSRTKWCHRPTLRFMACSQSVL